MSALTPLNRVLKALRSLGEPADQETLLWDATTNRLAFGSGGGVEISHSLGGNFTNGHANHTLDVSVVYLVLNLSTGVFV